MDDLAKWPVVDKAEMMADVLAHPPFGTYTTHDDALWAERGWMLFSSSGSTGVPRVFRYSQIDRELWAWANARALHAFGIRPSDSLLICAGYGPHVFAWGVQFAIAKMKVACIPGGGMTAEMRAMMVDRFTPTVLACTPSYALHLGRVMADKGLDPARSSVRTVLVGGEPAAGHRGHSRAARDAVGRAPRRVLRLYRGLAPLRRILVSGVRSGAGARHHPSHGRHPDLGARRRREPRAAFPRGRAGSPSART